MFTPHPQRVALHNEVHARPYEQLTAPLMLSHLALLTPRGDASLKETPGRPGFLCSPSGGRTAQGGGLGGALKETPGRPKFPCSPSGGRTPQGGGLGGAQ